MRKLLAATLLFVLSMVGSNAMAADCDWPDYIDEPDMLALASEGEVKIGNHTYYWNRAFGTVIVDDAYGTREKITNGIGTYVLRTPQDMPFGTIDLECE